MSYPEGLNKEYIYKNLSIDRQKIHIFDSVVSTNTLMKEYAEKGCGQWEIITASSQSGGKGRVGRSFFSPDGSGIYLSILLRPGFSAEKAYLITTCAAVACCMAIEKNFGKFVDIKWVNDIYYNGKKISGILTEGRVDAESGMLEYAVLGIGLNLFVPEGGFPTELEGVAGGLLEYNGRENYLRELAICSIISTFMELYPKIEGDDTIYREYRKRMFLTGKRVDVHSRCGESVKSGLVMGLDRDFSLLVRYDDYTEGKLFDGEVSLKISKDGNL